MEHQLNDDNYDDDDSGAIVRGFDESTPSLEWNERKLFTHVIGAETSNVITGDLFMRRLLRIVSIHYQWRHSARFMYFDAGIFYLQYTNIVALHNTGVVDLNIC